MNDPIAAPILRSTLDLIQLWLSYQVYIRELPGLSVGIAVGGETVYHAQFGLADLETMRPLGPDSLFRIASHSKLFTATAIMRLRAQGALGLDDRVADHLDWFRSDRDPGLEKITIRHLLTHSGGVVRDGDTRHWTYDEAFPDPEAVRAQVQNGIAVYPDGERFKYSNMGFTLLGEIVSAVTGKAYAEAVAELVVAPLGLKNTFPEFREDLRGRHALGYTQPLPGETRRPLEHRATGAMAAATGFSSTAADLLAFHRAHLFGSDALLDDSDKRAMQGVQFKDGDYEWGLGFRLIKTSQAACACHGGRFPGFITFSGLNQERKLVVAVLINAVDGPARALFEGITNLACLALDDPERFEGGEAAELESVSGFYRSLWGIDCYARIGGQLVGFDPALTDPAGELDVYERTDSYTFRTPIRNQIGAIGETIRFEGAADGRAGRVFYPAGSAERWEIPG